MSRPRSLKRVFLSVWWHLNPLVIIRSDVDMGNRIAVYRGFADRGPRKRAGLGRIVVDVMA